MTIRAKRGGLNTDPTRYAADEKVSQGDIESATPPPEPPEAKLVRLELENTELQDRLLRMAAEFENHEKRIKREADDLAPRVREGFCREILPIIDGLERAIAATEHGGTLASFVEGAKLLDKQFEDTLDKFGVKRFESLGQPFNPARHEAMMPVASSDLAPGTVAQVFAEGYLMGDRLLRAAKVAVTVPA